MTEHVWKVGIFYDDVHDVPLPYAYNGKGEVLSGKEIGPRLNENETLKADKRLLMHVVHGRAMASSLPKHLKEE